MSSQLIYRVFICTFQRQIDATPFDMVLPGMGEDGHTARLFPGQQHYPEELVHTVHNAPKPPPDRVSLSNGY